MSSKRFLIAGNLRDVLLMELNRALPYSAHTLDQEGQDRAVALLISAAVVNNAWELLQVFPVSQSIVKSFDYIRSIIPREILAADRTEFEIVGSTLWAIPVDDPEKPADDDFKAAVLSYLDSGGDSRGAFEIVKEVVEEVEHGRPE